MSEDVEHYPDFPLALLNTLTYFDFKLIERADRDRAIEKFEIRVKEMEHKEEKMLKEQEKEDQAAFELLQVNSSFSSLVTPFSKISNMVKSRVSLFVKNKLF